MLSPHHRIIESKRVRIQNTRDVPFLRFDVGVEVPTAHNHTLDFVALSGVTSLIHFEALKTLFEIV
jgi:hypothetical protein